jgi:hypothetical protein
MRRFLASLVLAASLVAGGCASNRVAPPELHKQGAAAKRPRCRLARTIRRLSRAPQEKLDALDKASAALTNEFKKAGVSGWKDTGCTAEAVGVAVRDAQESAKDFFTLDVELDRFEIAGKTAPAGRFIRVEIWPKTRASAVAGRAKLRKGTRVAFGGPVLIDEDGPFLEVHPDEDLRIVSAGASK